VTGSFALTPETADGRDYFDDARPVGFRSAYGLSLTTRDSHADWRQSMKSVVVPVVIVLLIAGGAAAQEGFAGRPITSNAFGQTGYTLHKNEFTVGLGPLAFGLAENFQLETNLLLWAFQVYNIDAKASLFKTDDRALAVGLSAYRLALDLADSDREKDFIFTAIAPYASLSTRLSRSTMGHIGGQYADFRAEDRGIDIDDVKATGSASGTSFFAGIEHSMSNRTKALLDCGYDTTFDGARISGAFLFGWQRFRLKLGLSYFTAGNGFTFPLVGLWWRFEA
jgi:hypothetical protein